MDLPPQPTPSAIEVTCEDDPLTLEWEVGGAIPRERITIIAVLDGLLLTACGLGFVLLPPIWGTTLLVLAVLGGIGTTALFMRAFLRSGRARLVLNADSLIWVPGDGRIPQVHRKSEVVGIEVFPQGRPRKVGFRFEAGSAPREREYFVGSFREGDLPWLAGVLARWLSA